MYQIHKLLSSYCVPDAILNVSFIVSYLIKQIQSKSMLKLVFEAITIKSVGLLIFHCSFPSNNKQPVRSSFLYRHYLKMGLDFPTQDRAIRFNFEREKQPSCNRIFCLPHIHLIIASIPGIALCTVRREMNESILVVR